MSNLVLNYGKDETQIKAAYSKLENEKIIERIWKKDHTIWSKNPAEISNRLGWLDSPFQMKDAANEIISFVEEVRKEGFENALLLGMGGSSLAPEVFSRIFGTAEGYLNLYVLDSTHPDNVKEYVEKLDPKKTLYIVSTKSGGTIETISFMKFFYSLVASKTGNENAGKYFLAITDPGSGLEDYAKKLKFRKIFLNNPDIGGRFSALSMFGLVPAALIGADINRLLDMAFEKINESKGGISSNTSAMVGAFAGVLANCNKDKLTFIISHAFEPFGVWVEQLIAESTGKIGKGILPIEREAVLEPEGYKNDRVFVYMRLKGENEFQKEVEKLEKGGFPVIKIELESLYELCAEFFRWEFATAIIGYFLGVQPFDQPDVESAKVLAREMIKAYQKEGKLPLLKTTLEENGIEAVSDISAGDMKSVFNRFFEKYLNKENGYVSIQAYVRNDPEIYAALLQLRSAVQKKYSTATTIGIGPRFLHSTGQLHKGDKGNGVFIQIFSPNKNDFNIPDEPLSGNSNFTFGILVNAQSLGDRQALLNNKREVVRFTSSDILMCIKSLTEML
jgi:glucose-6-phosphate isomerase